MKHLKRRYGTGQLHFITCSCYRRMPLLGTARARDCFLTILNEVRERYDFALLGYVVMPEHIHLLISEPRIGTPCVSRAMRRRRRRRRAPSGQMRLWDETPLHGLPLKRYAHFWQARFYDFNVWSDKKRYEKMNYMHFNPVKRGLVEHPKNWRWSSHRFYSTGEKGLCAPNPEWKLSECRKKPKL